MSVAFTTGRITGEKGSEARMNTLIKLTPTSDVQLGIYEEQLAFALSDPDVKNIALSGPYGAGKSSILATYKKQHPEKKFLHISFAHFQNTARSGKQLSDETQLEGKIINQLIHQMPVETIPQTHFQLLKEVDRGKIKKYIYWGVFLVALLVFICFHDAWCGLVDSLSLESVQSLLGMTKHKEAVLVAAVVCVILAVRGLTEYIFLQRNQRILRKVSFKGTNLDIELFNGEGDSYFDRYLNEVLYLFDHVDADAVVFEDIDRYDMNLIFERLREINTLANHIREQGREKKSLRFLYLIRDDVFNSKDRTKFFDMIIPVVPVMDGSNSYAMLIRLFGQLEEGARPSDDFLRGVSLYIDDMRLLGNIYNEYSVYYNKYQQNNVIELNTDKLLAMVVYKNFFPEDHSKLHRGKGYVYTLFHNKPQFIDRKKKELQEESHLLEVQLEEIRQETFQNIDELDAAYYVEKRRTRIPTTKKEDTSFDNRAEYITAIKANSYNIEYHSRGYYEEWIRENVREKFDKLSENPDYQKHRELVEKKADAEEIRQRISEIKNSIERLEAMPLHDVIDNENADGIFGTAYTNALGEEEPYKGVKRSSYFPLIPYLIRNGYIDESYQDYMSYYYADGLRREDKVFLRSLLEHNNKGANYHLEEPCKVISWMHSAQFEMAECLNYQLLDALLQIVCHPVELQESSKWRDVDYEGRLHRLVRYIFQSKAMEFFEGYLWYGKYAAELVGQLNAECMNAATWVLTDEALSDRTKCKYAMHTVLQRENYRSQDTADRQLLAEYVGRNTQFLYAEFVEDEAERFVAGIEFFDVKFIRLLLTDEEWDSAEDPSKGTNTLKNNFQVMQQVYQRQLYILNEQNVMAMLRIFYKLEPDEIIHSRLLTLIYQKADEPLRRYVDENLGELLLALTDSEEPLEDETDIILKVLGREDLPQECKEEYISALSHREELLELKQVKDKALWPMLMRGHVKAGLNNLTDYYFLSGNGMDEALVGYINGYLSFLKLSEAPLDKEYGEGASERLYADIVCCNDLDYKKYCALVKSFSFKCDVSTLGDIDEDKMKLLISWQAIQMTLPALQYIREKYPRLVYVFAKRNIVEYRALFSSDGEGYREEEFLAIVISDRGTLKYFLSDPEEPLERKQKALAKCVNIYKIMVVIHYLEFLELNEFIELLEGKDITLEQTPGNKALLDAFLSKNWIEGYDVDEQDDSLYRAQGKAVYIKRKR